MGGMDTDKEIDDALQEVAKYTIGDDEDEGFYDNWLDGAVYGISDGSESSHSESVELGMSILRVVSCQQNNSPEMHPNPSIRGSSEDSTETETESDEERLDLEAAKQSPLLSGGEVKDYQMSSDANNSDLP